MCPSWWRSLWSDRPDLTGDHELRRLAEEIEHDLQSISNTNRLSVIGGRPREIRVELDPNALAARQTAPLEVAWAIDISNKLLPAGEIQVMDRRSWSRPENSSAMPMTWAAW